MSRTTTTLALALSTLLLAGTTTLAGPKRPPAAATTALLTTYLTPMEQLCQARGHATRTLAQNRDRGISRFTALALVRREQATSGIPPVILATYEALIRLVYDFPDLPPTLLQHAIERECLKVAAALPATEADAARLRY